MNKEHLSAEQSFDIIQKIISERKRPYQENGKFIIMWGILIMIAGISQFLLIQNGKAAISGYTWVFTMIPGFIITFIVKMREGIKASKQDNYKDYTGLVWLVTGIMAMITGFVLQNKFGIGFTAALFFPFCIAAIATWLSLKEFSLVGLALVGIALSYASLFIEFRYHSLIAAAVALVLMLIPGFKLYADHKKRNHV